jgi:hypothetical protein
VVQCGPCDRRRRVVRGHTGGNRLTCLDIRSAGGMTENVAGNSADGGVLQLGTTGLLHRNQWLITPVA